MALRVTDLMAIVTGSRKYGEPKYNSDVDLVVFVTPDDYEILKAMATPEDSLDDPNYAPAKDFPAAMKRPLRFGPLNLICCTDLPLYKTWVQGTKELCDRHANTGEPVRRSEAVKLFRQLRVKAGIIKED